jgi:hypothetical protein
VLNTDCKPTQEVIVISDDSEPEFLSKGNGKSKKRTAKQEPSDPFAGNECPAKWHASNPSEIVNVIDLDSDNNSSDNKTKQVHKPNSGIMTHIDNCSDELPRDCDGWYIVTRKVKVDAVEHLDSIPRHWPVPKMDTAYILDFTDDARVSDRNDARKPKGLDTFLKAEVHGHHFFSKPCEQLMISIQDQDLWGRGTNGSTSHDIKLTLLNQLPTRRSMHECNGALQCEMFDERFLDGYEWTDGGDSSKVVEIFEAEQAQNKADGETMLGVTDAYGPHSQ